MIVAAATRLLSLEGLDALSMRRLADALEVSATALYYHVGSKDELVDVVLTRLLGSLAQVGEEMGWAEALEELLVRLQYLAAEYTGMLAYMGEHLECVANLLWMELLLRILKRGGFRDDQMGGALAIISFYNSAVPLRRQALGTHEPWEALHPDALAARLAEADGAYPAVAAMLPHLRWPDEDLFRLGLRALIAGLEGQREGTGLTPRR